MPNSLSFMSSCLRASKPSKYCPKAGMPPLPENLVMFNSAAEHKAAVKLNSDDHVC